MRNNTQNGRKFFTVPDFMFVMMALGFFFTIQHYPLYGGYLVLMAFCGLAIRMRQMERTTDEQRLLENLEKIFNRILVNPKSPVLCIPSQENMTLGGRTLYVHHALSMMAGMSAEDREQTLKETGLQIARAFAEARLELAVKRR